MSKHSHRASAAFMSMAAFAACALGARSAAAQQAPAPKADSAAPVVKVQWTGSFRSSSQSTGYAGSGSGFNSVTGSVRLTAAGANSLHAHITISTDAGISDATNLPWAIAMGDCRNGALPIAPTATFPEISVSRDRGELDADVSTALPTSGRYHVNIFWHNSTDESDVLTCASLKMEKAK